MSVNMEVGTLKSVGEPMSACRGCMTTEIRLYVLREKRMERIFAELTGLAETAGDVPKMCVMCITLLRKFANFREQCQHIARTLQRVAYQNALETNKLTSPETYPYKNSLVQTKTQIVSIDSSTPESVNLDKLVQTAILNIDILPENETKSDNIDATIDIKDEDDFYHEENTLLVEKGDHNEQQVFINEHDNSFKVEDGLTDDDSDCNISEMIKKEKSKAKKKTKTKVKSERKVNDKNNKRSRRVTEKKYKVNKELPEYKRLVKEVAEKFKSIWRWNDKLETKMEIFQVFEFIYEESVAEKSIGNENCGEEKKSDKMLNFLRQEIKIFLELNQKLSVLLNVEVEYLSVAQQQADIERRRHSSNYTEAPYKCELCAKIFNFSDTYERHSMRHKEYPEGLECSICHYRFRNRIRLMQHIHNLHFKKIKCLQCGFLNRQWLLAKEHFEWHGGVSTVCKLCGTSYSEKKLYYMHLRRSHRAEVATAQCPLCGDTYKGEQGVKMHMDRAHKQAAQCPECFGWFVSGERLAEHRAQGDRCQPEHWSCSLCDATFSSEELLRLHHADKHSEQYKCEQCNRLFPSLRKYRNHAKIHARRRNTPHTPHTGPGAGGQGGKAAGGGPHKAAREHKGHNYVCDMCGRNDFKYPSSLRIHQMQHRREKPYSCSICRATFTQRGALKVHMSIHSDEMPHKCPHCPKVFRLKGNRDMHVVTHTKEKPYSCSVCLKKFSFKSNMIKHMKTLHEGHPLPARKSRTKTKNTF